MSVVDALVLRKHFQDDAKKDNPAGWVKLLMEADPDDRVAKLVNDPDGPDSDVILIERLSSDTVRKLIVPAVAVFGMVPAELIAKWQGLFALLQGSTTVENDEEFQQLMTALVADFEQYNKAMNKERVLKYTTRRGSLCEILFGADVRATAVDIGAARW